MQSAFSSILNSEFAAAYEKMGISTAVYQNGVLWKGVAGQANETTPMTPTTPIRMMSTSRTFVGVLVLSQVEAGLYSLDDQLSTLLADHTGYQSLDKSLIPEATVRQLLTMTAGVQDFVTTTAEAFTMMTVPTWSPADTLRLVTTPPGPVGTFSYANNSSIFLGMIAEHKGGSDLYTLYQTQLLAPTGIKAALLPIVETPADLAAPFGETGEYGGPGGFGNLAQTDIWAPYDFNGADGRMSWAGSGMFSTPENIALWAYEVFSPNGTVVSSTVRAQLLDSFSPESVLLAGRPQNYGFHAASRDHLLSDGTTIVTYGHPGGGAGYSSALFYAPSLDMAISILANTDMGQHLGSCVTSTEPLLSPFDCITRSIFAAVDNE